MDMDTQDSVSSAADQSAPVNQHMCHCGYNGHMGHGHFLLRWVLGAIILLAVFVFGVAVGHVVTRFHGEYDGVNMKRGNVMFYKTGAGMQQSDMMNIESGTMPPMTQTAPVTPATPKK